MTALKVITSPSGARFSVAADHAERFQALVNDLEAAGYPIKSDQSGGYNYRNIDGTDTLSPHAFGRAIDVNWSENARGKRGTIPEDIARDLARKHGMTWGGGWKNRDDMHFEVADTAPRPMNERGLTSFAGLKEPAPSASAPMPFGLSPVTAPDAPMPAQPAQQAGLSLPFGLSLSGGPAQGQAQAPEIEFAELPGTSKASSLRPLDMRKLAAYAAERRKLGV